MKEKDCVFCKIIAGELPANFEYEDEDVVAFRDIEPSAPTHVLVIPKRHIKSLAESKDADIELLGKIQIIAKKVAEKCNIADGFKVVTNSGAKAGQIVHHIHYHVMGGWKKNPEKYQV